MTENYHARHTDKAICSPYGGEKAVSCSNRHGHGVAGVINRQTIEKGTLMRGNRNETKSNRSLVFFGISLTAYSIYNILGIVSSCMEPQYEDLLDIAFQEISLLLLSKLRYFCCSTGGQSDCGDISGSLEQKRIPVVSSRATICLKWAKWLTVQYNTVIFLNITWSGQITTLIKG